MAGESARAYARRKREKGERLIREAERWERGAAGEAATAAQLDTLRAQGWVVFHDVRWPGRPRANIDHIAIGPGGVFVIDSKNWAGSIAVRDGVLLQNGRRRESTVAGAGEAALAITGLLGDLPATGVLCFVRDEPLNGSARDVMVCSTSNLTAMLTSRPPILHPTAVPRVAGQLSSWLASASELPTHPPRSSGSGRPATQRSRDTSRTSKPRTSRLARKLMGLGFMGIALLVVVPLLIHLVTGATHTALGGVGGPKAQLGETLVVDGNASRPTLAVTALGLGRATVSSRVYPLQPGRRLVALDLRIANQGDRSWTMLGSGSTLSMTDSSGVWYHPVALRRAAPGVLPSNAAVRPRGVVRGRVLFELPKKATIAQVTMNVGPGVPRTLRWQVSR